VWKFVGDPVQDKEAILLKPIAAPPKHPAQILLVKGIMKDAEEGHYIK